MNLNELSGLKIVISPHMINGYEPVRHHKKKRIHKKWLKRYGEKPIYDLEHCYIMGDCAYMSKGMFERLKESIGGCRR